MQRWNAWMLAGLLALLGPGCDDRSDVPPAVKAQSNPLPATKPLPTTQELLTGAKKRLRLPEFPLSIEVPASWALQSIANGEIFTVSGQGTAGNFDIQLVQLGQPVSAAGPEAMVNAAKQEAD